MIDSNKLQYYTMSHRLRGYADGVIDKDRHSALIYMLEKSASLLEHAWDEYQQTLPQDQRVGS
jgi:hypothetical protein